MEFTCVDNAYVYYVSCEYSLIGVFFSGLIMYKIKILRNQTETPPLSSITLFPHSPTPPPIFQSCANFFANNITVNSITVSL